MVLCAMVDCGRKTGKGKAVATFRIPAIITHQGNETEELTRERRMRWISAISRDDLTEQKLQNERVCSRHFVSGKPAQSWDKFNIDWVPTLNLGHTKNTNTIENMEASAARAERAKRRRQSAIEQQEQEVAEKRRALHDTGKPVSEINFVDEELSHQEDVLEEVTDNLCQDFEAECYVQTTMDTESGQDATKTEQATLVDAETQTEEFDNKVIGQDATETEQATMLDEETQTEEFDYLFQRPNRYSPPDIDFFDTDDKIRFYTGLPTKEILITTFQHVAPHVPRRSTTLNNFQEFVLVLTKLRLNMPFQKLAFRFGVKVTTISRIFSCWITVMDVRLAPLIFWPERDQLWKTMPVCFQYSVGKKVTVIIDCFGSIY